MVNLNKKFFYKAIFLVFSSVLLLAPIIASAQDQPCGSDASDPFDQANCPLDTYVWALAIIALMLGAVYLYRQQKLQSKA
jgi:hypothetical protein